MQALTGDKRFTPLTLNEAEKIQFRIDKISDRQMINFSDIKNIDPVKNGIIAINRNYKKLASILPNMSPKILT
jgi:AMMECR1 domain-containing protein